MKKSLLWTAAIVLGAAANTPVRAAVIFDGALASTGASVSVGRGSSTSDPKAAGTLTPSSVNLSSSASDSYTEPSGNEGSAAASSKLNALINSPEAGQITFEQSNQAHTLLVASTDIPNSATATATARFFYDFTVDTDSIFALTYEVTASGYSTAFVPLAQVAYLQDAFTAGFIFYTNELTDAASGTVNASLIAGSYRLAIDDFYLNSIESYAGLDQSSSLNSRYNFAITSAVPEPATWAMLIGGFGLVGGAMRVRGRKLLAPPKRDQTKSYHVLQAQP